MRRLVAFLIILVVLIALSYGISIILFPEWLSLPKGSATLLQQIFVIGLGMIADAIVSWLVSFLFADKDFNERKSYVVGDKYKNISKRLDEFTLQEIGKEKKSRKYIPNIFVETTEIKEKLRYFSEPYVFFSKIVEQTDRELQTSFIVNALKQIHYPVDESVYPKIRLKARNQKALKDNIQKYRAYLDQKLKLTSILIKEKGAGIKPEYKSKIPLEFAHIHEYVYPNLQFYWSYEHAIKQANEDLELLKNKLVIIKSIAGHGKTNLLCDFAENFLLKKRHKCLYISARALNHLGEQETIEQAVTRMIFTEPDFQFSDILRLVNFDKKIDYFYILIDGINEHKNSALFSVALEQFILRCSGQRFKIILTCRSEYFDDRFGNLLHIDGFSLLDIDDRTYAHEIPEIHQDALISRYFSEFRIQMHPNHVSPDIVETFYRDKLLLRIFCEAYEDEQTADHLDDLYKLEIFNKYFEKKLDTITGLDNCLEEIVSWMIEHNEFTNIRMSNFSNATIELIEATTYENVIIKKDIVASPGLAFGRFEVVNFVYDEFRDFLIASKVLLEWDRNNQSSLDIIQNLAAPRSPVAEGLQRYLCLWSIKNKKNDLLNHLSSQGWFDEIFIDSVFDTPDSLITSFVVDLIEGLFTVNATNALRIIWSLIRRANIENYPNLNIEVLFSCLNRFDEAEYEKIVIGALGKEYNYKTTHITHLCRLIIQAFREKRVSGISQKNLIKVLGYSVGVVDYSTLHALDSELGKHPASEALYIIAEECGGRFVRDALVEVIASSKAESIKHPLSILMKQIGEG